MIPRSTRRLVVASVALSDATTLGLSLAALLPARRIVGDAKPVCFLVPGVAFRLRVEAYDPIAPRAS